MMNRFSIGLSSSLLLACVLCLFQPRPAAAARPNIVFFLVDDLGWGSLGAFGSNFHETPNLDRLCADGMKFTQAYSACTVCSPSRAAILTGQYPARTHLTDWVPGHARPNAKLSVPDWSMQMAPSQTTLAEALREGGYRTGFFGKWHLLPVNRPADMPAHFPEKHGFELNIGGREWGQPKGRGKYFYPFDMPGLDEGKDGEYLTDRLTDEVLCYLDEPSDKPFFAYVSYYTVHGPLMAKEADKKLFEAKLATAPKGTFKPDNPTYAAMHKSLDESVGRVVERLKATGRYENTLFIFTGDNGGDMNSVCGGLRGFKGFAFEGGTRVPTFIVWPGVTKPGSVCDTPVIGTDYYPTLLDVVGLPARPTQHLDGVSLVPLLKQSGTPGRQTLYWHYPHYHRTKPYGAIRHENWKLIEFFEDGQLLLFDLATDPREETDLAAARPQQAQQLLELLKQWRQSVGAQMPAPNPDHDPQNPEGKKTGKKASE